MYRNNNRIDVTPRRQNNHNYSPKELIVGVIVGIIFALLISDSSMMFQFTETISFVLGWYTLGLIALIILMYLHHTENGVARILFVLYNPLFKFVGRYITKYFPIRYRVWVSPVASFLLLFAVQELIKRI